MTEGIKRRTVTRGAAWVAPVVVVSVAAPAIAASSPGCLNALWTEAVYSGAHGRWSFCFDFSSCGTEDLKVTAIDVWTTYHSPATNTGLTKVDTLTPNLNVPRTTTTLPVHYCNSKEEFTVPPKSGSSSLLPAYYNDYPPDSDGLIDCVAKAGNPVYPGDPLYPDSCTRLSADGTFVIITYTSASGTSTLQVPMSGSVGCRVTAGCK